MIGNYIVVEYEYMLVHGDKEPTKCSLVTSVYYPQDTDELYKVLDDIAARRGIALDGADNIQDLRDIVDVHIIEDMHWEDDYMDSRGLW